MESRAEQQEVSGTSRGQGINVAFVIKVLGTIWIAAFIAGLAWSRFAKAEDSKRGKGDPQVVYPKHTELDFEGTQIEGEVRNAGEFYFKHKNEEKFDSLVKRRKNFHPEMLRDAVLSK